MLPINWPAHFEYSPISISVDISANLLRHLLSSDDLASQTKIVSCIEKQRVHPHLRIQKITKNLRYRGPMPHPLSDLEIFPGHGQHGVFAKCKIPKGAELGEYVGMISFGCKNFEPFQSFKGVHCWRVEFGVVVLNICSEHIANELAFINDYRGLGDAPNVRSAWILHRGGYYFGYETTRVIEPMEELLADYGKLWAKKVNELGFPKGMPFGESSRVKLSNP